MNTKTEKTLIINTVDYNYPSCGGVEIYLLPDGDKIEIRQYSNYQGTVSGTREMYMGFLRLMAKYGEIEAAWNDLYTIEEMLGQGEYERLGLTLISRSRGMVVR